jgi:hypothetical protein
MKGIKVRFLQVTVASALFCAVLLACGGSPAPASKADELDAAIRETSDYLNKQLPKGNKLVILNVQSEFPALSEYIIDELIANTVNDRVFSVVDRQQLNTIRAELDFQMSGEVDDATAQALGRMAGAQIIISGAVSRLGDLYRLRIRALSVQSAQIEAQFNRNIPEGSTVAALVQSKATGYGNAVASGASGGGSRTPAAVPTPVQAVPAQAATPAPTPAATVIAIEVTAKTGGKLYFQDKEVATLWDNETHTIPIEGPGTYALKMVFADHTETRSVAINTRGVTKISFGGTYAVGQTGPAGGIIFYDKGSYSDGWRYLEVAPASTEFSAQGGGDGNGNDREVNGTSTAWGYGKVNTQTIVRVLSVAGDTGFAAQICANLNYGGFNDWYLPSKDELNLMYLNIRQKGLGGFSRRSYWSSSQYDYKHAWFQNFDDGKQDTGHVLLDSKADVRYVRAVRAF